MEEFFRGLNGGKGILLRIYKVPLKYDLFDFK